MATLKKKFWMGSSPDRCDVCKCKLKDVFVDGKTAFGPWAIMCPTCHTDHGKKLGLGLGQRYEYVDDRWEKTGG